MSSSSVQACENEIGCLRCAGTKGFFADAANTDNGRIPRDAANDPRLGSSTSKVTTIGSSTDFNPGTLALLIDPSGDHFLAISSTDFFAAATSPLWCWVRRVSCRWAV